MKTYLSIILFLFVINLHIGVAEAQTDELQEVEQEFEEADSFDEESASDEELDELLDESEDSAQADTDEELDDDEFDDDEADEELANDDETNGDEPFDDEMDADDEEELLSDDDSEQAPTVAEEEPVEEEVNVDEEVEQVAEPEPNYQEPMGTDPSTYSLYDEPDHGYEQSLFEIYQKYYSEPLAEDQWQSLLQGAQKEFYDIQSGDNLWDISKMLFGDGHYWPKVWSLNGKIYNPHLIKPGHRIYFILGDESSAPSFKISEASGEPAERSEEEGVTESIAQGDSKDSALEDDEEEGVIIPPPSIEPRPVVRVLPPSLPEFSYKDNQTYDDLGFSYDKRKVYEFKNRVNIDYIIKNNKPSKSIVLVDVELGGVHAGPMQYVYLKSKKSLSKGDVLVSFENIGFVNPPIKAKSGYALRFLGEVEVTEKLPVTYQNTPVYKAIVKKAIFPLKVGSVLAKGRIGNAIVSNNGPQKNISGYIIGGKYSINRSFFSLNSLVYLNVGSSDDVQVGDMVPIRMNRKKRFGEKGIHYESEIIGLLKVVDVDKDVSTGLIVQTKSEIQAGDFLGKIDAPIASEDDIDSDEGDEEELAEDDSDSDLDEDDDELAEVEESDENDDEDSQELADDLKEEVEDGDDVSESFAESEAEEDASSNQSDDSGDEWSDDDFDDEE